MVFFGFEGLKFMSFMALMQESGRKEEEKYGGGSTLVDPVDLQNVMVSFLNKKIKRLKTIN